MLLWLSKNLVAKATENYFSIWIGKYMGYYRFQIITPKF